MSSSRIQPVLTKGESELVDQVAELTHAKRTEVIKNALAVYHWFVRQSVTGARIVAREPTGEEKELETPALFRYLLDRLQQRKIPASQLEPRARWLDTEAEVPEDDWFKRFSGMTVCGEGELIKTFLLAGQSPKGQRVE